MVEYQEFSSLLYELYGIAKSLDSNKQLLTRLKKIMNLKHATLIVRPPSAQDAGLFYTSGEDFDIELYGVENHTGYTSLYTQDPLVNLPLRKLVSFDELVTDKELVDLDYYKLILKPLDIHYIAGYDWPYSDGEGATGERMSLRFFRSPEQGRFTAEERQFLELFIPHFEQAIALSMTVLLLTNERQVYTESIIKRSMGIVTLDREGRVLKMNNAAAVHLKKNDGIFLAKGKLRLTSNKLDQTLSKFVEEGVHFVLDPFKRSSVHYLAPLNAMSVPRTSGKADYELVIKPAPVDAKYLSHETPCLIVFIQDPSQNIEISVRTLMKLYQLTLSEATISILLAEGNSMEQVAEELQIKKNTVRAHLRSIFVKTGVTQQTMLVSLVLTSLAST